ncbi:MAG TPA: DNA-directed RNA polymerase subunit alpha C-terminal domain-containing protein [Bacteroidia bacterium]|nr:DNA-directed RNA polymerase subunit alpha C-terminal domain-containing protein [Bacteroidia bacterium]
MTFINISNFVTLDLAALETISRPDLVRLFQACEKILTRDIRELPNHIAGKSIKEIGLDRRALNCLLSADIYTIGQLMDKTEQELFSIRNFGKLSMIDVRRSLEPFKLIMRTQ